MSKVIKIPELSVVALVGASGSGKSTLAQKLFKSTEILSSDFCRGLVCDDENSQSASKDAFEVLYYIAGKRLAAGKMVVIDATNLQMDARKPILALAREHNCLPVAIALKTPVEVCLERNESRSDRDIPERVIRQHCQQLKRSLRALKKEGFRYVHILDSMEDNEDICVIREPLWNNKKEEHGPFDIIGDIHGCYDELLSLLGKLGYEVHDAQIAPTVIPPEGRKAIFLGDLVDRGPGVTQVLKLVMKMVDEGTAFCVPGNHEVKLHKHLIGKNVQARHGLQESITQLEQETSEFREQMADFINGLISHYVLDNGNLVVAHAGMRQDYQGRGSGRVRQFALYGETTGETDEYGLPVRYPWAEEYRGHAMVVYGHTPVPQPLWLNNTVNIDTGCVFGGELTALRYPEKEFVSVPAAKVYSEPVKPAGTSGDQLSAQQEADDILDIEDVLGKRRIHTELGGYITVLEANSLPALETISRFAVNPKWLIHLPPTMSPCETAMEEGFLEHPAEAFSYYRNRGVEKVVCEEKHMGSRAVLVLCKNSDVAEHRFGVKSSLPGECYTRTGRPFFKDEGIKAAIFEDIQNSLLDSGFWDKLESDWVCLDCEVMPWSEKAKELVRQQYAATGTASVKALTSTVESLKQAETLNPDLKDLLNHYSEGLEMAQKFGNAYRRYCWEITDWVDYKVAPFHILATENQVHTDKNHEWHMETLAEVCHSGSKTLLATPYKVVNLNDPESCKEATEWWLQLTADGGEGMVVKPHGYITKDKKGVLQPAIKCRGREYLRIIYGYDYTRPKNMAELKKRGLATKRKLAIREFSLGLEALQRFVDKAPLRKVHECVFGVLALETEPVDPRL
jgi:protein phosphatase